MNERIRELLQQSTNPPWDGEQGPMNEFNLERFAELIVRECMRVADSHGKGWAHLNGTEGNRIRQHFGIEL
jgi:hypothetical protein